MKSIITKIAFRTIGVPMLIVGASLCKMNIVSGSMLFLAGAILCAGSLRNY